MQGLGFEKAIHTFDRSATDFVVPCALVAAKSQACGFVERGQQIERNISRLIIGWIGRGNIVAQRADGGIAR